jgi:predicted SAM-dependent methyltransferase
MPLWSTGREPVVTKYDLLAQTVDRTMFGLEVGPSYNPALPRADGWNVETIDHASAEDLRAKYKDITDVSQIGHVDYISDALPMHEVIKRRGEYDFILASHVIEHVTDFIGFLQSCELLLKPEGQLILVVPDKRKCFDVMQARTTTGQILEANRHNAVRHNPGSVFDFISNTADLGGLSVWENDWARKRRLAFHYAENVEFALSEYNRAINQPEYIDIHAWRFVPSSFRLIMQELERLGFTKLKETLFEDTNHFEFYFAASAAGLGCTLSRLELSKAIASEEIEGLMQIATAPVSTT